MSEDDHEAGDRLLAHDLDLSLERVYELVGRGWELADLGEREAEDLDPPRWYVAGEPPQVMLGVAQGQTAILVARPRVSWEHWRPTLQPEQLQRLASLEDLAPALARVAASRRRTFRWCRYCRTLAAPEDRYESNVCSSCAEVVLHVVH